MMHCYWYYFNIVNYIYLLYAMQFSIYIFSYAVFTQYTSISSLCLICNTSLYVSGWLAHSQVFLIYFTRYYTVGNAGQRFIWNEFWNYDVCGFFLNEKWKINIIMLICLKISWKCSHIWRELISYVGVKI